MSKNFEIYSLGDLAKINAGGDKPSDFNEKQTPNYSIPVYANGETNDGLQGFTTKAKITEKAVTISARGTIGFSVLRRSPYYPIVRLLSVIPNKDTLNVEFLYYYLKLNRPTGIGSSQAQLIAPELSKYKISIPNITSQQKIASVLSALDNKIEVNNKINAELEAMSKTLYDYWFVQFDFPNEEGKPYKSSGGKMVFNETLKREIPEGWEVKRLEDIVEVKDGTHDSPKYITENGYPLVTSKNLKKSGIDFSETNKITKIDFDLINQRSKVDTGDILFSMIGNIGTIYKVEEEIVNFAIKNVALFKTSTKQSFKNYLYQYLHEYDMQRYIPNVISGSIQKFIALGSLRNSPILYHEPTIKKYTELSSSIYYRITLTQKQNQELVQLRDWLLPMLMNGQVTVGDVADEFLGMVAEPFVDYQINNLTDKDKKIRRKMLATYIINQSLDDTSFGKTKFEKLLHLVESHIVKGDYNQKYSVQAAGPYDGGFTKVFWNEVTKSKWFEIKEFGKLKRIVAGENHIKSQKDYGYLSDELKELINNFISKFKNSNYERPEIVSTLFAVWNNRIIRKEMITDALLKKDFLEWDEQKARYENRLDDALAWMRNNNVIPTGWGNEIKRVKK